MGFKYVNPGYPWAYGMADTEVMTDNTKNPINGVCPKITNSAYDSGIIQPFTLPFPSECEEIWAKTGVYLQTVSTGDMFFGIGTQRSNLYGFYCYDANAGGKKGVLGGNDTTYTNGFADVGVARYSYHEVLIHSKNGQNGFCRVFWDGVLRGDFHASVSWKAHSIAFSQTYKCWTICNTIISDTEITPSEQVYIVSKKTPTQTMSSTTVDSVNYCVATSDGQQYETTLDVSSLTSKIKTNNIKVTSLGVTSKPAYREGDDLIHLASTQDGTEKEVVEVSTNKSSGYIHSAWDVDMNYSELSTTKVGLKAKT